MQSGSEGRHATEAVWKRAPRRVRRNIEPPDRVSSDFFLPRQGSSDPQISQWKNLHTASALCCRPLALTERRHWCEQPPLRRCLGRTRAVFTESSEPGLASSGLQISRFARQELVTPCRFCRKFNGRFVRQLFDKALMSQVLAALNQGHVMARRSCLSGACCLREHGTRHRVSTSRIGLVPLEPDSERLVAYLERRTPWDS
jgi:hypothetical protein